MERRIVLRRLSLSKDLTLFISLVFAAHTQQCLLMGFNLANYQPTTIVKLVLWLYVGSITYAQFKPNGK